MCTVVCDWSPGADLRILALRDELTTREFDLPDAWWPELPGVVGGRDRVAGGSWCVTDVATGATALVLNRIERRDGHPSRGTLPLAAVTAGERWTELVDPTHMASFTLVLAAPSGVVTWAWTGEELRRVDLDAGTHMITTSGVDTGDAKTQRYRPRLTPDAWRGVLDTCTPEDDRAALVVRHEVEGGVYATVFGQIMTVRPGRFALSFTRTPWDATTWQDRSWDLDAHVGQASTAS